MPPLIYSISLSVHLHIQDGSHFLPGKITNAQLTETKIENLSRQMKHHAPDQQGRFPNFVCTRLRTSWTVHSRGVLGTVVALGMPVEEVASDVSIASVLRFSRQGIFSQNCDCDGNVTELVFGPNARVNQ